MTVQFHETDHISSWGRIGRRTHKVARPRFVEDLSRWNARDRSTRLAIGARRSYSDVALADGGRVVDMTGLSRFRSFDPDTGLLVAEAGVTLDTILTTFVPRGYFLPVTPGTRFATLGGAVANDVHGKNHHRAGTLGCHVHSILLERSDLGCLRVSPFEHPQLFAATIGGLGLTGMILEVRIRLQRVNSANLIVETSACSGLDELCDGLEADDAIFEHKVGWIDCTARGSRLGRGLLSRANWASDDRLTPHADPAWSVPTDRFDGLLNPMTLRLFNKLYFAHGKLRQGTACRHYAPFMYPLDSIRDWNRLYGRRGFYQYQCVVPDAAGREPIRALLAEISASGEGSFLAVLKRFGDIVSPGLLSFPKKGFTLALDFRNRGDHTLTLLARLDTIVASAEGRLYPAKDLRIPPSHFRRGFTRLDQFLPHVDPSCCSDFWTKMSQ